MIYEENSESKYMKIPQFEALWNSNGFAVNQLFSTFELRIISDIA
jgi:hypothetical protein